MAGLTLSESLQMTNDRLQAGVIETLATESKLLAVLPFMTIEGAGYSYNVETDLADVQFRAINEGYTPTKGKRVRKTEHLVILGGEAVVDSFQAEVHSDVNDLLAVETTLLAKSMAHQFEKTFLSGDSSVDTNAFDGLRKRAEEAGAIMPYGMEADEGVNTLAEHIDILLDSVQGGTDALIMNKATRRKLTREARESITYTTNDFGVQQAQYGGVNIIDVESDILATNNEVYAVRFGAQEAVAGLQSRSGLNVRPLGEQDATPQLKNRIEWFVGLAVFNPNTVAVLDGTSGTPEKPTE